MKLYQLLWIAITLIASQPALADERFTISGNAMEVQDTTTGLIWRRCSEGQVWDVDKCTGKAQEFNYKGALAHANRQVQIVDKKKIKWRVPTIDELATLVNPAGKPAAIDVDVFPGTTPRQFWSATPHESEATQAMVVYFKGGHVYKYHRNNKAHLRLVR
jgi:hypothetical protein